MAYNLKIISSGENRIEIYKITNYEVNQGYESKNKERRKGKENWLLTLLQAMELFSVIPYLIESQISLIK